MPRHTRKLKFAEDETDEGKVVDCVYFFKMNGCGHCEQLKPIWAEAVSIIKTSNPEVKCIEIESAEIDNLDNDTKEKLKTSEIVGYPDLRILKKNGQVSKFESNRTVEELVKWIKDNTSPKKLPLSINRVPTPYPKKTHKVKGGRRHLRRRSTRRRRHVRSCRCNKCHRSRCRGRK